MGHSWFPPDVRAPRPGAAGARTQRGGTGTPHPPEGRSPTRAAAPPPATRQLADSIVEWLIRVGLVARG